MPNYVDLTIYATGSSGPLTRAKEKLDLIISDPMKTSTIYPNVPEDEPVPYYDQKSNGSEITEGLLRINAVSHWRPPLKLLAAISQEWPEIEVVLLCSIEHFDYESWHFKAGIVSIVELFSTSLDGSEEWYVRDGKCICWPEGHYVTWKLDEVITTKLPEWATAAMAADRQSVLDKYS